MKNIILILFAVSLSVHVSGQEKHDISNYSIPNNIKQCFKVLDNVMTDREKSLIKTLPEDSLYNNTEIGYETDFLDAWGLNSESKLTRYFNKKGLDLPNKIYETILISYHRYLNKKEIDLEGQIEKYIVISQRESIEFQQRQDSIQRQFQLTGMINESLLSYLNFNIELHRKVCKNCGEYATYICIDNYPIDFVFSEEVLSHKNVKFMSLMNISGQKELKRKKGYGFIFLGISLQEEKLIITFSSKIVSIPKKHHLNIAVSGWGNYTYKYSSEKQKWNLVETKYGGI